jgi:hypothetical protein
VYTVWRESGLIYVGMSGRGAQAEDFVASIAPDGTDKAKERRAADSIVEAPRGQGSSADQPSESRPRAIQQTQAKVHQLFIFSTGGQMGVAVISCHQASSDTQISVGGRKCSRRLWYVHLAE